MLVLEFNQYDKYLSDEKFMKYFKTLQNKIAHIYPEIQSNLELVIDKVYAYYDENYLINDLINRLVMDGNVVHFTAIN